MINDHLSYFRFKKTTTTLFPPGAHQIAIASNDDDKIFLA
jgi:hypothetical protein